MKARDLSGQRFGRLTAQRPGPGMRTSGGRTIRTWVCACDCGATTTVRAQSLTDGNTTSCGCLRDETIRKHRSESRWNHLRPTSQLGGRKTSPEYSSWQNMLERCRNPKNPDWPYYGGRKIDVCPEWLTFDSFMDAMGEKPSPEATIDRINPNDGYHPANCRWTSRQEQSRNRAYTVAFRGFKSWELAELLHISLQTMHSRLSRFRAGVIGTHGLFLPQGKKRNPRRYI